MAIYEVEGGWVCSSGGCYLPGSYESRRACNMAFRTPDFVLWAIWEAKRDAEGVVPDGVNITEADIREYRSMQPQQKG